MTENLKFNFNSVIETAKKVVTQPKQFYEQMPKSGGYTDPLIFVVVMGVVAGLLGAIISLFGSGHVAGMSFGLISIIVMPIIAVIGSFIGGLIMFVIWKLMGSSENYETAFRCVAFSFVIFSAMPILGLIPYLGTILSHAWWFWLMLLASTGTHKLDYQKSLIVFGVLALIMTLAGLSGERTQRHMQDRFGELNSQLGELNNMTPEELGESAGEFLKGLEKAAKAAE